MRSRFKNDSIDWKTLRSCFRPCPAEKRTNPNYRRSCSQCLNSNCKRMADLGLSDAGEPLPKNEHPKRGAKTRAGGLYKARVVPGKRRCRLHAVSVLDQRGSEELRLNFALRALTPEYILRSNSLFTVKGPRRGIPPFWRMSAKGRKLSNAAFQFRSTAAVAYSRNQNNL